MTLIHHRLSRLEAAPVFLCSWVGVSFRASLKAWWVLALLLRAALRCLKMHFALFQHLLYFPFRSVPQPLSHHFHSSNVMVEQSGSNACQAVFSGPTCSPGSWLLGLQLLWELSSTFRKGTRNCKHIILKCNFKFSIKVIF